LAFCFAVGVIVIIASAPCPPAYRFMQSLEKCLVERQSPQGDDRDHRNGKDYEKGEGDG
ncbi:MAG: hypothetical protein H7318_09290, partial [Oligoflexus sp.]|nr:hypothetical protein [Oligoflexus sp.]